MAKGLRRYAAGFFTPFGRSHRPEAVSPLRGENDIAFSMLGNPTVRTLL